MDYSQLSDFEINKLVAAQIMPTSLYFENGIAVVVRCDDDEELRKFDPCNYPEDAWPIIKENMISIGYDGIAWEAFSIKWDVRYSDWRNHPEHPLRIAMILFLMGKEKESADA